MGTGESVQWSVSEFESFESRVLSDFLHRCIVRETDTVSVYPFLKSLSAHSPVLILHFCALDGFR